MTDTDTISLIRQWLGDGSINIFGIPFAGKDTQANLLAKEFNAQILGGGEILRNSTLTPNGKAIMEAGGMFPTQEYVNIVLPYLSKEEFAGRPLILSSVGRWHGEEDGVVQALEQSRHPLKAVVFLNIDESVLHQRWEAAQETNDRGDRADDGQEKLATRLAEFHDKTVPVIEYYRSKGLLIEIDASAHVMDVCGAILDELASRASTTQ